jgi:hypothetical protein
MCPDSFPLRTALTSGTPRKPSGATGSGPRRALHSVASLPRFGARVGQVPADGPARACGPSRSSARAPTARGSEAPSLAATAVARLASLGSQPRSALALSVRQETRFARLLSPRSGRRPARGHQEASHLPDRFAHSGRWPSFAQPQGDAKRHPTSPLATLAGTSRDRRGPEAALAIARQTGRSTGRQPTEIPLSWWTRRASALREPRRCKHRSGGSEATGVRSVVRETAKAVFRHIGRRVASSVARESPIRSLSKDRALRALSVTASRGSAACEGFEGGVGPSVALMPDEPSTVYANRC